MIQFTVITCVYNAESVLQRTLDSVRRQSYHAIEHLIIDGASTDATLRMAKDYQSRSLEEETNHDVVIYSEPDKGLYDAMNKGIARATGDYLVFLNAGDTFPADDTLEMAAGCVGEAEELPAVLYGDTHIVDEDGHFLRVRRLRPPRKLTWRSFSRGMLVCHQSFYALRAIARDVPYDISYRYSADVDWCIRVMKEGKRRGLGMRNTQLVLTNFLDGGMTTRYHRASLKERFRVMRKHYGLFVTLSMHAWFLLRALWKR